MEPGSLTTALLRSLRGSPRGGHSPRGCFGSLQRACHSNWKAVCLGQPPPKNGCMPSAPPLLGLHRCAWDACARWGCTCTLLQSKHKLGLARGIFGTCHCSPVTERDKYVLFCPLPDCFAESRHHGSGACGRGVRTPSGRFAPAPASFPLSPLAVVLKPSHTKTSYYPHGNYSPCIS